MKELLKSQRIIVYVMVIFFCGSIMQNILATKTFLICGVSWAAGGILLTPFVFACSDIITEIAGKKFAFKCILIGAFINICVAIICQIAVHIPGNNPYIAECYGVILGGTFRITAASIIAYVGGACLNNYVMSALKKRDNRKHYYKRAIFSTFLGQLVDDYAFCLLAFAPLGISVIEQPWAVVLTLPIIGCILETIIEAVFTPVSRQIVEYEYKLIDNGE